MVIISGIIILVTFLSDWFSHEIMYNFLFEGIISKNNKIELPKKYKGLSINNKLIIKNNQPLIIQLYLGIGLSIDPIQTLIYSESDNEMEIINLFSKVYEITKIENHWYYAILLE